MGQSNFDTVQANAFLGAQFLTQGKQWYVKPRTGSDGNTGRSPQKAFKTLAAALAAATANQNDVVWMFAEGQASAGTTDYQAATLNWNKDLVHLIGVNSGPLVSQRSRIALLSTYATASNLFTVSANGCLIENVSAFAGVASVNPTGCLKVTGQRNVFRRCHLAGIGNAANDIAGAYSVNLSGAAENLFDDCQIGLDTIARGAAANCELLVDTAAARNAFRKCTFNALISHATNHPLVRLTGATAIDRTLEFGDCMFINESVNYAIAQAGVFKLSADLTQGFIILNNCYVNPSDDLTAVKWDVDDRNRIALFNAPTPAADTAGAARMV